MWLHSIYVKSLRDQRWQIVGFGLSLAAIAALDVLIWPAYKDQLQLLELPPAIEAFLGTDLAIGTPAGFLNAEFFSWVTILLIVYAVMQGTGAIAGEESSGTMDLLLAQPVHRSSVVLAKAAAAITGAALIILVGYGGFLVPMLFVSMAGLSSWDVFVACANMLPVTLFFLGLSLWLGAVAPSRAYASGAAIAVATAAYLIDSLAAGVESISGMRYASPFYYYGRGMPLVEGIEWPHVALLVGLTAIFIALAMRTFERRDIAPGGAVGMTWSDLLRRVAG